MRIALILLVLVAACSESQPPPATEQPIDIDKIVARAATEAKARGLDLDSALANHQIVFFNKLEMAGKISSASCSAQCNSNIQCEGILQACKFCSFGKCSAVRPLSPAPTDTPKPPSPHR